MKKIEIDFENTCGYLAKDGKSGYSIVYSASSAFLPAVEQAAAYIQEYVLKSAGVLLPILTDDKAEKAGEKYISLGKTCLQQEKGVQFDYALLAHDGFFVKTTDGNVFIDGVSGRGVLYGAFDFLERVVGVKFLAYDDIFTPKAEEIVLPSMDVVDNPDFADRCFSHEKTMNDPKFMAQMRMINEYVDFPEKFGGNIGWFFDKAYVNNAVHNTMDYIDFEKYYKTNPEWFFAENDYAIDFDYSHVGLTEEGEIDDSLEVSPVKLTAEKMFQIIYNAHPSIKYFMIGQMDFPRNCECPDCLAQAEKYGRSGMLLRFVNAIAREVRKRLQALGIKREYFICTFAYQWSQSAPAKRVNGTIVPAHPSVVPEKDVLVRICTIKANQYYSIIDEKQLAETKAMFEEWATVLEGRATMVWSYHSRFTYPFCFFPTMQHWLEDFAVYQKMGCQYLFMEPNHFEPNDWKTIMETYIAAKLLWNNGLNPYELREEFLTFYYGPLKGLVAQFIDNYETLFEKLMASEERPNMALQGLDSILQAKWYPVEFWAKQLALVGQMYAAVSGMQGEEKAKMEIKVDRIALAPISTILYKFDDYQFDGLLPCSREEYVRTFFQLCDKLGVKRTGEWQKIEQLKEEWGYVQK